MTRQRKEHRFINGLEHKHCSGCDTWLLVNLFGNKKTNWDKLQLNCKDCKNKQGRNYRSTPKAQKQRRNYLSKPSTRLRIRQYEKNKRRQDSVYRLKINIRRAIASALSRQGYEKVSSTAEILGADYGDIRQYLITKFESSYSVKWDDKYLELLQVDHIEPIALAKTEQDILRLNHHTNLQYLWYKHNLDKSDRLDWTLTSDMVEQFKVYIGK